jgi:HK97 family phage prohead protease
MTKKSVMIVCEARLKVNESQGDSTPQGLIEATVTTWGPREGADGRRFFYKPEGFADWAQEFSNGDRPLPMFVNHSADELPVGEWTGFEFTDTGMNATGRLFMNTTGGADLYKIMNESPNMFGGVSIGAYAHEYQWVKESGDIFPAGSDEYWDEGYFQITKGGLSEVSVVMYPNNEEAQVSKLEYFREDGSADLKVLEKTLREAGLSKKDAVTSASVFKKVLEQRDVAPESIDNAPPQSESDVDVTKADEILRAIEQRELLAKLTNRLKG